MYGDNAKIFGIIRMEKSDKDTFLSDLYVFNLKKSKNVFDLYLFCQ